MKRHRKDSGFAMLLVLLMAAVIAITLYSEIPRVAFEAQRQKEQLLVARGEQYKRAITVFFRENKRYPAKIEDLESFNNKRYLRKRFVDPLTGKDEWRIIHIANGVLTDSKTMSQKKDDSKTASVNTFVGVDATMGAAPSQGGSGATSALNRRRASDGGPGGAMMVGPDGQPVQVQQGGVTMTPPGTPGGAPLPGQVGQLGNFAGGDRSSDRISAERAGHARPTAVPGAGSVSRHAGAAGELADGRAIGVSDQPGRAAGPQRISAAGQLDWSTEPGGAVDQPDLDYAAAGRPGGPSTAAGRAADGRRQRHRGLCEHGRGRRNHGVQRPHQLRRMGIPVRSDEGQSAAESEPGSDWDAGESDGLGLRQ